jgi:hypothetical protein
LPNHPPGNPASPWPAASDFHILIFHHFKCAEARGGAYEGALSISIINNGLKIGPSQQVLPHTRQVFVTLFVENATLVATASSAPHSCAAR